MDKMKILIVTVSTLFIILKDTIAQEDGFSLYSRRYERLDMNTILASPRLVTNYVDCLLSKKPCPPEGKALKRILPEALRTKCERCWPSQKEGALKVITALYNDYPKHYSALRERWDPTGEYHRRFEEYLRDQKFNVISNNGGQDDQGDTSKATQRPIREDISSTTRTATTTTTTTTTARTIIQSVPSIINPPVLTTNEEQLSEASGSVEVANRFGAPEEDVIKVPSPPLIVQPSVVSTTKRPQITKSTQMIRLSSVGTRSSVTKRQQHIPQTVVYQQVTPRPLQGFVSHTTLNTNNPILNIINHLTLKVANTAELLTGMLHGVTSQDQ